MNKKVIAMFVLIIIAVLAISVSCDRTSDDFSVSSEKAETAVSEFLANNPIEEGKVSAEDAVKIAPTDGETTITKSGSYLFEGNYGAVIIGEAGLDLHFILKNAAINSDNGAALDGSQNKKTNLTLTAADGTENVIFNDGDGANAVHIKGSLTVNGGGTLNVVSRSKSCIKASKGITVANTKLVLASQNHGISGSSVSLSNCSVDVTAKKDGINAEADGVTEYVGDDGYVRLSNVHYVCDVMGDGIQADSWLYVNGGEYDIKTNGTFVINSEENKQKYDLDDDDFRYRRQGDNYIKTASDANLSVAYALAQSCKGFKVGEISYEDENKNEIKVTKGDYCLIVKSGKFRLDCCDDAVHVNSGDIVISGGEFTIDTKDDGITADRLVNVNGGSVTVNSSYEGIEGGYVQIYGGTVNVRASDDGINAASDDDSVKEHIIIGGGSVTVNADGDGLDSNGKILISGGNTVVYGPTSNADGALDADEGIVVTGGTLIALSSMGMAETPSDKSSQFVVSFAQRTVISANSEITLTDSGNNVLIKVSVLKNCQSVIISSPELKKGGSYSLLCDGKKLADFTVDSQIVFVGEASPNQGEPGRPGFGGGQPPRRP